MARPLLVVIGGIGLSVILVALPLVLDVVLSFFPNNPLLRRVAVRGMDRGGVVLIAALCASAYSLWWTVFLPFHTRVVPSAWAWWAHVTVANGLWWPTVILWARSCIVSPRNPRVPPAHWDGEFCKRCSTARISGVHHCRTCDRCIAGHDHHCPFIGNCVGDGNKRGFLGFLAFATAGSGYSAAMSGFPFFQCIGLPIAQLNFQLAPTHVRPDGACRGVSEYSLLFVPTSGMFTVLVLLLAWQVHLRLSGQTTAGFIRRYRAALGGAKC